MSGYLFYSTYLAIPNGGILGIGSLLTLALGVAYISYIGFTLAKFVSAKVEFDDNHFEVKVNGVIKNYKWSDIASIKNYHTSQILKLFDSTGTTIYVVDHMTPGYNDFFEKVSQVIET